MLYIDSLTFNDGSKLAFKEDDIVVFVGANNAGKSASLKEIQNLIHNKAFSTKIIKDISYKQKGDVNALKTFLRQNAMIQTNGENYNGLGFSFSEHAFHTWNYPQNGLQLLSPALVKSLGTQQRLTAANPASSIAITTQPPSHPIHHLQRDEKIEEKFSNYFRQAFNLDLIVHRNAGNQVPLYIGDRPIPKAGEDRVSINFLKQVEVLPKLENQGDGMRAFVGVLLDAFHSIQSILLIDEPEAFLHPPQASLLGRMLGKDLPLGKQIFISTHSEHVVKGLLDVSKSNLKIIRINRENDINHVSLIDNTEINSIWNDSLLRHSNILDGLFHSQVILCESDSDCRFFSAMVTAICESEGISIPDIHFVQSGGKHRFPVVVKALVKLNVPLKIIGDIDLLNNENPIRPIYEGVGGNWSTIEKDFKIVKNSVDQKKPELVTEDLKEAIEEVFKSTTEKVIPKEKIKAIEKLLEKASPWSEAKNSGRGYLPNGDASSAFNGIIKKLGEKGILILEVGEIESFDKTVGGHGPAWVSKVLEKDLINSPELKEARSFVRSNLI